MDISAKLLSRQPFFKGMNWPALEALAASAMHSQFAANEVIFKEGDPANRFYLLLSGRVVLEARVQDAAPVPIQTIEAGDVLGWSWMFPPFFWRFGARAIEPVEAIFFYGTRLREQAEDNPSIGYELMKRMTGVMLERLQATRQQLAQAQKKLGAG